MSYSSCRRPKTKILTEGTAGDGSEGIPFIYRRMRIGFIAYFSSETTASKRRINIIFKVLKENSHRPGIPYIQQNYLSKMKEKYFLRQTKTEGIYCLQTCPRRNVKRCSGRRKIIKFRNFDIHKKERT